ncbi:MAG TPA: hypothetical protein VHB50_13885, partial [Bryobacteraceae bacterium]|nr:hypothetical protein [Bryobacteraceae bacterium]
DFFRNQINYPTNDATQPNAQGLHLPTSLAVDSAGNLFVADTGNSRILRFPAPFTSGKTTLESADLVIGQSGFNSIVTDATAQTMSAPMGIALTADAANASVADKGWLVVSDTAHSRVLFFQKPFSTGMSASKVLGSLNFTSFAASGDPQRFNAPRAVAVDPQDRVLVADTGNRRVQIFNPAANINNYDTPPISVAAATGGSGFSQPLSISATASGFWVADAGLNTILHFPTVDQLPLKNNTSDATTPVLQPTSAFADNYGNVLAGDGANRVLYFAPQVTAVSAASYSSRPLTPGSIAALFPTVASNMIAAGTDASAAVPLSTALADTQVLVNGKPAPLFYASPGQINFQISNSLPAGGTADLQVVRQSTGQVYGAAELSLASADPALFTVNASGGGQIFATNFTDGSMNSAANPVTRGSYLILYGTGVGPVPNAPPDGQGASGALSAPTPPQIVLGSNATAFVPTENIVYSGLSTLVGVWQINLLIPPDAPTGNAVPIRIFQNSISSTDASVAGAGSTTIAIQ